MTKVSCHLRCHLTQSLWLKSCPPHSNTNTLQHTATHCNTLQHTAAHSGAISARSLWLSRCLAKVKVSCKIVSQKCLAISHVISFAQMVSCQSKESCERVFSKVSCDIRRHLSKLVWLRWCPARLSCQNKASRHSRRHLTARQMAPKNWLR